jgi:hypothetical protein
VRWRAFVSTLALSLLVAPYIVDAPQAGKVHRTAELVRLNVDVIVASAQPAATAAKDATTTIPIVFPVAGAPIETGLVASLARPGGNVTGLGVLFPELSTKRLERLKECVPRLRRVAVLWNATNPAGDQPEDREGARFDDPSVAVAGSRSAHRMMDTTRSIGIVGVARPMKRVATVLARLWLAGCSATGSSRYEKPAVTHTERQHDQADCAKAPIGAGGGRRGFALFRIDREVYDRCMTDRGYRRSHDALISFGSESRAGARGPARRERPACRHLGPERRAARPLGTLAALSRLVDRQGEGAAGGRP